MPVNTTKVRNGASGAFRRSRGRAFTRIRIPALNLNAFNGIVYDIRIHSDGKIFVCGTFTQYDSNDAERIVRLYPTGAYDSAFDSQSGFDATIYGVAVDANGKPICSGAFTDYDGTETERIARLTTAGALDSGFDASGHGQGEIGAWYKQIILGGYSNYDTLVPTAGGGGGGSSGIEDTILAVVLQSDGDIDDDFECILGDTPWTRYGLWAAMEIFALKECSGGFMCCGYGTFPTTYGTAIPAFYKIGEYGAWDTGFGQQDWDADMSILGYALDCLVYDDNGTEKYIVCGNMFNGTFDEWLPGWAGTTFYPICMIDENGDIDSGFSISGYTGSGQSCDTTFNRIEYQSTGKIIAITGDNTVVRINTDGTADTSFNADTEANGAIYALAIDAYDRIIIGGAFTEVEGETRNYIAAFDSEGNLL